MNLAELQVSEFGGSFCQAFCDTKFAQALRRIAPDYRILGYVRGTAPHAPPELERAVQDSMLLRGYFSKPAGRSEKLAATLLNLRPHILR